MIEAGHVFLARLGKTVLRPGGTAATEWLIDRADIRADTEILEVACNAGRTMIRLSKRFNCSVTGVDIDKAVLAKAAENIKKNGLQNKLSAVYGDAQALPFKDGSFDLIINEAMLTMLSDKNKDKALKEYFRILRPGGMLLTQDVVFTVKDPSQQKDLRSGLSKAINVSVEPLDLDGWKEKFCSNGFDVTQKYGKMTLLSPSGMPHDEGILQTLRIIRNAIKKENRSAFGRMFLFFNKNKDTLGYVCNACVKPAHVRTPPGA
ncbi:class I SAM-dependent methyltransferase [Treponema parvum]|uniref:class I SAM-dependent methyltransferase n=1 Tax=Treponema parvum TaxID=138851 RepID=UPI001AEC28EB|nr:class I SAM-dependent methyltransferase [Treponema parvum]QTQ16500.1 class I SAM-dependent methyltransferase [Treponema parvum]